MGTVQSNSWKRVLSVVWRQHSLSLAPPTYGQQVSKSLIVKIRAFDNDLQIMLC